MFFFRSTEEAAANHGVSARRLRTLLQQGRVVGAMKVGGVWIIPDPLEVLPPSATRRAASVGAVKNREQ